jgi:TRAP-type C4-dicarboxylate transport system permease small subunit
MNQIRRLLRLLDKACHWFIIMGMMVMTLVLFAQIFSRYALNSGIYWSEELARFIMIWVVYLGAAVVYRENTHISVTALEEALPPKARRRLKLVQKLFSMAFMGMVGWFVLRTLEFAAMQTSPSMMIPMNRVYLVFPVSSALIIAHLALSIVDDLWPPASPAEAEPSGAPAA